MIRYALSCDQGHGFDSWFASAEACDRLLADRRVTCIDCGSTEVAKALMAPQVSAAAEAPRPIAPPAPAPAAGPLRAPRDAREAALAALRREIEAKSDYVGLNFAAEARAIHAGEAPERSIYGEARLDEARALIEDGVPVAPLPFRPARKSN